jgi:hypothetical protein
MPDWEESGKEKNCVSQSFFQKLKQKQPNDGLRPYPEHINWKCALAFLMHYLG